MSDPWLSIITVVKDAVGDLVATVDSIVEQSGTGVELVVIDSSSDRDTVPAALSRYSSLQVTYAWTPPSGIYPAMNEGLRLASGDYVYYLNAGDTLLEKDSLASVHMALQETEPEWLFADVQMLDDRGRAITTPDWDYDEESAHCFSRGHFPCHQGTFARRESLQSLGGFDTSYEIVADYAMFLCLSLRSRPGRVRRPIAAFAPGGVSTIRWRQAAREFHRARREILRPSGARALRERWETWRLMAATGTYRALWAPGRPAHGLVARLRERPGKSEPSVR